MSLESIRPPAGSLIEPSHAWILGIVTKARAPAAPIVVKGTSGGETVDDGALAIRDDCACPDSCARDHDNE